ncbi:GRB2-associated-binding protein 1-like isoform X2 [Physella acuta]|uniref:GRB2-associated-binding protein 1-like isoform X2 n=1 Tax=Physella acuta TaxID=109671 RepID=UPI0027DDBF81|nr:GRB2-associated-binding protein 1-like isoform X2 [Physella acuta]
MKRRKPSTKMTNVVHSGWMTKSPPERRLNTTFRIFRAQWKRRYFVLRKPSGSLPDQYELHYYKDEQCNSRKGSIDLEQCEQIIEALDSDIFPNLLAIKTFCRNKVRTYYLAADTEQEMNNWVQWLCHVCGLRPEDQHLPEQKPQATTPPQTVTNGQQPVSPPNTRLNTPQPTQIPLASNKPNLTRTSSNSSSTSYIQLEHCTTGPPATKSESTESVPNFTAPDPPQKNKNQPGGTAVDDDVFVGQEIYDHPRSTDEKMSSRYPDLYQTPPARPGFRPVEEGNTSYDIPPTHDHSPRFSTRTDSATSGSVDDRAATPPECYDYPPPRLGSTTSSDSEVPPERPPKPSHMQSPYQNLPPAGKGMNDTDLMSTVPAPPKAHTTGLGSGYDIPRSSNRTARTSQPSLPFISPPSRQYRSTTLGHTYLNTQTRPGSGEVQVGDRQSSDITRSEAGAFGPPAVPPPRNGSAGEDKSASSSLYQYPPSSASSLPGSGAPGRPPARGAMPQPPPVSPRNHDNSVTPNQDETTPIFSTQRTRSFKRQNNINNSSPKLTTKKSHPLPMSALVPAPRPAPPRPKEDEEESLRNKMAHLDTDEETHHPLSLLHSVPAPAVDMDAMDRELKYIDLELTGSVQDAPRPTHSHGHTHSHTHMDRGKDLATEYREIDFVKTQALSDAKKVKEKERKNDDHN